MSQPLFADNEKILCFHGPLLYEAKCLSSKPVNDASTGEASFKYYVHYNGWNKTWDEWVDTSRVLKYNEENLLKAREFSDAAAAKKKKNKASGGGTGNTSATDDATTAHSGQTSGNENTSSGATSSSHSRPNPDRRRREGGSTKSRSRKKEEAETEDEDAHRVDIQIVIPDVLKSKLVDDWDYVTRQKRLVHLIRKPTVTELLEEYKSYKIQKQPEELKGARLSMLTEVVDGLRLYFDRALGKLLLYRFERQQYADTLTKYPNTRMSDIYGAEHLLRLFVKLPSLLAQTTLGEEAVNVLVDHLHGVLKYMEQNNRTIFLTEYSTATPEYCRLAIV